MTRLLTAAFLAASLASAAGATTYAAKPAVPVGATRIVARDIVWSCGPAACAGNSDQGRPVVLCQALARKTGRLESFLVDGRALAAAELGKCNSAARADAKPALAAAQ